MKVIMKGKPQKGWSKEFICTGNGNQGGGCGATLLVEQADLFKTHRYIRDEHDVYITFKCVSCGVLTDLPESVRLPPAITSQIPDDKKWIDPNTDEAKAIEVEKAKRIVKDAGFEVRKIPDSELYAEQMGS